MPDTLGAPRLPAKNDSKHGRVTAVSMMKDEGPFVLEWIAHHMAVGFTDIVVFTNDCTDGTDEMLIRLQELGLAHHRVNAIPPGVKPQPSAIRHAQAEPVVQDSDWVLVFDADEFLSIRHGDGSLEGLLDAIVAQGANGMVITWRIFGSGGVHRWSREFVTEQYLMAAPHMWNKGWGVKTLFRFDEEKWKLGIHRPTMKNKVLDTDFPHSVKWLNGSGREMEEYFKFRGWRSILRTVGYDWAQMNHYAIKSIDSYALRRFRGNVNNKADKYNAAYWALQDRNEVRDDTMLRYSDRRREIFEGLLGDPVLRRLHDAAMERVEARLDGYRKTPEYNAFVDDLKVASEVPITRVVAKPPKERDPAKIAARMKDVERRAATHRQEEKAKPPAARMIAPVDAHVRGAVDMSSDPPLDWHPNHDVLVPADPRIFTPPALLQIVEGKFERNLARNLPALPAPGGRVVEIGAASGFLACRLALARPDLEIAVQTGDGGRRLAIARLLSQNGVADQVHLGEDIGADLSGAEIALVGDPALSPPDLAALLDRGPPPVRLFLVGRLWVDAFAALSDWERVLNGAGYGERLAVDPLVGAGYGRIAGAAA